MRPTRTLATFAVAAGLCLASGPSAFGFCHHLGDVRPEGFCLSDPGSWHAIAGGSLQPSGTPPFCYFDLRELPGCVVPYSFYDPTKDVPAETAFQSITNAFDTWGNVQPALIAFTRKPRGAGAKCPFFKDNHNILGWDDGDCKIFGDDTCIPPGGCACGTAIGAGDPIIGAGPDGWVTTTENNCPGGGDDEYDPVTKQILNGTNGTIDTRPNTSLLGLEYIALTANFADAATGQIFESDILFNDEFDWVVLADGADRGTNQDIETIALHEIGHFLGLHHVPGDHTDPSWPIMQYGINESPSADHTLAQGDEDGINFLYTPDLGDAPDPFMAMSNEYPSLVHGTGTVPVRWLNDVPLFKPRAGAEHLFGFFGGGVAPRYQHEWLGTSLGRIDDSALECEARVPDADDFDDGVAFSTVLVPGANTVSVAVTVQTATDIEGGAHAYGPGNPLFVNGWFDWNADGDWTDGNEHVIGAAAGAEAFFGAATRTFSVSAPADARPGGYARFRLDYGEDVGQALPVPLPTPTGPLPTATAPTPTGPAPTPFGRIDPSLTLDRGPAQFGEVEDYRIPYPDHYLCYSIKDKSRTLDPPPTRPTPVVDLQDQFDDRDKAYRLGKPKRFCVPAEKNGEGVTDELTHLKGYAITKVAGEHVQPDVEAVDQFGTVTLHLVQEKELLVPSSKALVPPSPDPSPSPGGPTPSPSPSPDPTAFGFEHYKCYRASLRGAAFPRHIVAEIRDQFGFQKVLLRKPVGFCAPVSKNREGIRNDARHLTCYAVRRLIARRAPIARVTTVNQFGPELLYVQRERELCVPSVMKSVFPPQMTPTPAAATPTPTPTPP